MLDGGNRTGIEGAHVYAAAIAPDGSRFSYTNSAPEIPVWPLSGDPDIGHPPVAGRGPGHAPTAMALAPGGQRMAVADSGTIYVSTVGSPKSAAGDYTAQLTGVGDRPTSFVTFAGDASHVVSSAGNQLALWNLDQAATIAESQSTTLVPSCLACPGTIIRVSPDGHQVAYTESFEGKLVVHDLTQDREIAAARDASPAAPSWSVDGHELYLPLQQQDALVVIDASTGNEIRRIPVHRADTYVGAQTLSATSVAVFDESGGVSLVDLRTNSTRYVPWPSHRQGPGVASAEEVSISPDATTVYYATAAGLSAMNLRTGRLDVLSRATDFAAVAAEGTSLLVTRYHSVEVRALSGALQRRVAGAGVLAAASGGGGLFAYQTDDGTVHILETGGLPLGTFALPGSAEARKTTLAFTADGSRLFALTEGLESGGRLESWQLSPSVMISMLCRAAGRRLTASAWRAAAPGQPFVSGCD